MADLITAKAAPGDRRPVNDTVRLVPAIMRPLMAARPDAYRKLIDLSLWQRATDRNDVPDTNLIPEASAGPLSDCHVVWIITEADKSRPAHEQDPLLPPGPRFGGTPRVRGSPRPRVPASGALAVQPSSGHQGGAISARSVYQRRARSR